ncbi:hypothetical protein [Coleofasciculus sp. E1-EBD-02]|uniref:hypothetical protein n=1 Tax=Coleofasciculus sp. E1-EBD-02 TaxID=3068481 RepID=UPI0032FBEF1C
MQNNGYNYRISHLWEILTLRELMVISQEISSQGFKDIKSLRKRIARLQVTLNSIEVSIDWNLTNWQTEQEKNTINPQQFTEIIEWIETNYPELSKLNF